MSLTETQKIRLLQLQLFHFSQYAGSTSGAIDDEDWRQVENVLRLLRDPLGDFEEIVALTLGALGYTDHVPEGTNPVQRLSIGLRKAFGMAESEDQNYQPQPQQALEAKAKSSG